MDFFSSNDQEEELVYDEVPIKNEPEQTKDDDNPVLSIETQGDEEKVADVITTKPQDEEKKDSDETIEPVIEEAKECKEECITVEGNDDVAEKDR